MKTFQGRRLTDGTCVVTLHENGKERPLPLHLRLFNHSLSVEWGYAGSGPAQLALALLAESIGDKDRAVRLHQKFKFKYITPLAQDTAWEMTSEKVRELADQIDLEA